MKNNKIKIAFDIVSLICMLAYVLFCAKEAFLYYSTAEGLERAPAVFLILWIVLYGPFLAFELYTYIILRNLLFHPIRTTNRTVLRIILLLFGLLCLMQCAFHIPASPS